MPLAAKPTRSRVLCIDGLLVTGLLLACDRAYEPAEPTPPAVAKVDVYPGFFLGSVGQSTELTAITLDAYGYLLGGTVVSWSSSDSAVVRVTPSGVATAAAVGLAEIVATSQGAFATVQATVFEPPVVSIEVDPPTAVIVVGQRVRLEAIVKGGSGDELRDRAVEWSSGDATVVRVDVDGLATAVAEGSATITATSERQSGQATITVQDTVVASVTVTPGASTSCIGSITAFTALPKNARGRILTGKTVTWSSSDPSIATVDGGGRAMGISAGTTTIVATSGSHAGSVVLSVMDAPPASDAWPNQPRCHTLISDMNFDSFTALGWSIAYNTGTSIVSDSGAPLSPSNVMQSMYTAGFPAGIAPGTVYKGFSSTKRIYVGLWWKPSDPWQGNSSGVNKIQFLFSADGNVLMQMFGSPGGPYHIRLTRERMGLESINLVPNVNSVSVTLGQWHKLEWLIDYSANGSTGIVRWWLDGVLIGDYQNVQFTPLGFNEYQISPTWGGVSGVKTQVDYYWYDHVHLSR